MISLSLLAVLIGAILFVTRLPGLFYPKEWRKAVEEFTSDKERIRLIGVFALMLALTVWHTVTYSVTPWEEVMAIIGYLLLVWSIMLIYSPEKTIRGVLNLVKGKLWKVRVFVVTNLAIGIILISLGLFIY